MPGSKPTVHGTESPRVSEAMDTIWDEATGTFDHANAQHDHSDADNGGNSLVSPTLSGTIQFDHTATENDDHALEIDCDAAGFSDVKAVDLNYISGAIAAGEDEAVILVNIDESAATGGDITAIEVLATEGDATLLGLFAGALVAPIEQLSGVFVDTETFLDIAVDETATVADGGAGSLSIFENDNETITIGMAAKFEEIEFLLGTGASGAGISPTFEYSTGVGTWATFGPVDGTNAFKNTGVVAWLDSDIPSWAVGTGSEYLIRITRTRNSLTTTPIVDQVGAASTTEYYWDKDGDILANSYTGQTKTTAGARTDEHGPYFSRWLEINADPGASTTGIISGGNITLVEAGTQTGADQLLGAYTQYATAASTSAVAGFELSSYTYARPIYNLRGAFTWRVGANISDVRYWWGFFSADPSGSDTAVNNTAAFRFSTGAGDSNWQAFTTGTGSDTITDTGVVVATGTEHRAWIEMDHSSTTTTAVRFYIDDALVATHTTNLPVGTTFIGPAGKATALAAASKQLRLGRFAVGMY